MMGPNCRARDGEFLRIRSSNISCLQCLRERRIEKQGHGKKSIHFNGSDENIELLLRTVISANQLSIYGAVPDLCNDLSEGCRASVKPEAPDHLETTEVPTSLSNAETHTNAQQR